MFYQPVEYERENAPEAFKYELGMFRLAITRRSNEQNKQDKFISNALLECALLHARNLLEFFTGKISHKNDNIIASHFVDKPPKLPYLESLRNDINKRLSHLTYTRVKAGKEWDLPKISDEIEAAHAEFLNFLPEEDRSKWLEPEHSDVELC